MPVCAATDQWETITPPGASGYQFNTIAGIGSFLYLATDHGVFKSINGGQSWTQVNTGLGPHVDVTSLAIGWIYDSGTDRYATTSSTYIFAGTSDGGIFASTLSDPVWIATSTGLSDNSILDITIDQYQATQGSFNTLYAATPSGVFISTTTGSYWRADNTGLSGYAKKLTTAFGSAEIFALTNGNASVYGSRHCLLRDFCGGINQWIQTHSQNEIVSIVADWNLPPSVYGQIDVFCVRVRLDLLTVPCCVQGSS
jgi:hypothetical protein